METVYLLRKLRITSTDNPKRGAVIEIASRYRNG
jgi:hypothetical protein